MRCTLALLATLAFASTTIARPASPPASTEMLNLGLRGVYFVPNEGQWSDAGVYYGFKSRGADVAFRESSFIMHIARQTNEASPKRERGLDLLTSRADAPTSRVREEAGLDIQTDAMVPNDPDATAAPATQEDLTLTVTFPGCNEVTPEAANPQSAKFNYYLGDDKSKWASNVPSFGEIVYPNLYDGIDLHVKGAPDSSGVLKYEFHVAPGADYSQIQIHYDGIDSLCVDSAGNLQIATPLGTLTDAAPIVWQGHNKTYTIAAHFDLLDEATYLIAIDGSVDPTHEVTIDPDIDWMYYYGGHRADSFNDALVEADGDVVILGYTNSDDFVGRRNGLQGTADIFVMKASPLGQLLWMSYYGGSSGEDATAIRSTSTGGFNIAGSTSSPDFPARLNSPYANGDAFLLSLDSEGAPLWMVYLGGNARDAAYGLALDDNDTSWVVGETFSTDFFGRINNEFGYIDAFAMRVDRNGTVEWMRYFGGPAYPDSARSVSLDSKGNAYVFGDSTSHDFQGAINQPSGGKNAFVLRVTPDSTLDWMIYFGGDRDDTGWTTGMTAFDELYIGGTTNSFTLPDQVNEFRGTRDAYVAHIGLDGSIHWTMFVGGTDEDSIVSIAFDEKGNLVLGGGTASDDIDPEHIQFYGGPRDAYIARVSPIVGVRPVYFGGSAADGVSKVISMPNDTYFVAGTTQSTDFFGRRNGAYYDADGFLLRYRWESRVISLNATASCPSGGPIQINWSNATPSAPAALLYARNTGSFTIPSNRICAGTTLGLGTQQLQIVFTGNSDANGSRTLNANAGLNACGAYLQLLDLTTCTTSNVATIE